MQSALLGVPRGSVYLLRGFGGPVTCVPCWTAGCASCTAGSRSRNVMYNGCALHSASSRFPFGLYGALGGLGHSAPHFNPEPRIHADCRARWMAGWTSRTATSALWATTRRTRRWTRRCCASTSTAVTSLSTWRTCRCATPLLRVQWDTLLSCAFQEHSGKVLVTGGICHAGRQASAKQAGRPSMCRSREALVVERAGTACHALHSCWRMCGLRSRAAACAGRGAGDSPDACQGGTEAGLALTP